MRRSSKRSQLKQPPLSPVVVHSTSDDGDEVGDRPKASAIVAAPRVSATLARKLVRSAGEGALPVTMRNVLVSGDEFLAAYRNVLEKAPPDAFKSSTVTKLGDSVYTASYWERAANHFGFFRSTGYDPSIYNNAAVMRRFDNVSINNYPDFVIFRKGQNVDNLDAAIREAGEDGTALRNTTDVNQVDNVVNNDSFFKRFRSSDFVKELSVKKVFYTVTGVAITVGAGMLLTDLIKEGIAKSSGCFIYDRTNPKTVQCFRVLGYSCGDSGKLGDERWIRDGLPTKKHFFADKLDKEPCPDSKKCKYCDMESLATYPGINVEEIPLNQSIFCRQASMMEILDDMLEQTGKGIRHFIGSLTRGLFGDFDWVSLIVAVVGGLGAGGAAGYVAKQNKNRLIAFGAPILVALVTGLILYFLTSAIRQRSKQTNPITYSSAPLVNNKSDRKYYKIVDNQNVLAMHSRDINFKSTKIAYTDVEDANDYNLFLSTPPSV